jgi:hypothetical protein
MNKSEASLHVAPSILFEAVPFVCVRPMMSTEGGGKKQLLSAFGLGATATTKDSAGMAYRSCVHVASLC